VLITSNQYGVFKEYVQVPLDAQARGATVVAMCPRSDPNRTLRTHPSGKAVFELADVLIETHLPYGDAALPDEPKGGPGACPTSGTIQTALYWALTCGIVERLKG
jgi:uncharacterized phosphosugar-binding protein